MRHLLLMCCACTLAVCFLACPRAMAYEVTADDVFATATETVVVKSPPNPGLVGFFKSSDKDIFAYALIERGGHYDMYVKIRGKYEGWATATIDGDEIIFGKQGKARIKMDPDGSVNRLFGGLKTPLVRVR